MAWTIGTAEDHADVAANPALPRTLRLAFLFAFAGLLGLAAFGTNVTWALPAALFLLAARLLGTAALGFVRARPPQGGPCFALARLEPGPVLAVGRVLPPERGLLSPLTSTKCSFYDYAVELLDESTGQRRVVDEGRKLTDFWLKDVTGSVWVESAGIDIRIPRQLDEDLRRYDQTPRAVGERLQKLEINPFLSPGVRRPIFFHETRLDPGDNVLVRGEAVRDASGRIVIRRPRTSDPGAAPERVESGQTGHSDAFTVERWTRATFVPIVPSWARRNLWLGAAAAAAGLVLLFR
ncbi:MAG: hypothetical protein ACT4PU_06035 [Planctomycetota bacterium]